MSCLCILHTRHRWSNSKCVVLACGASRNFLGELGAEDMEERKDCSVCVRASCSFSLSIRVSRTICQKGEKIKSRVSSGHNSLQPGGNRAKTRRNSDVEVRPTTCAQVGACCPCCPQPFGPHASALKARSVDKPDPTYLARVPPLHKEQVDGAWDDVHQGDRCRDKERGSIEQSVPNPKPPCKTGQHPGEQGHKRNANSAARQKRIIKLYA